MMMTKGMTRQEVEEMMTLEGWALLDEEEYTEDGVTYYECTVEQGDHAVGVSFDADGRVSSLQYVPAWAL